MWKYTVKIDGMMCGMCESHMNDVVRRNFDIKKVSSSAPKGETTIITENELDLDVLKKATDEIGYVMGEVKKEPYEKKKGLFGLFG